MLRFNMRRTIMLRPFSTSKPPSKAPPHYFSSSRRDRTTRNRAKDPPVNAPRSHLHPSCLPPPVPAPLTTTFSPTAHPLAKPHLKTLISHIAHKRSPKQLLEWYDQNQPMDPAALTGLASRLAQQRQLKHHRSYLFSSPEYHSFLADVYTQLKNTPTSFTTSQLAALLNALPTKTPRDTPLPAFHSLLRPRLPAMLLSCRAINCPSTLARIVTGYSNSQNYHTADVATETMGGGVGKWFVEKGSAVEVASVLDGIGRIGGESAPFVALVEEGVAQGTVVFEHESDLAKVARAVVRMGEKKLTVEGGGGLVDVVGEKGAKVYERLKKNQKKVWGRKIEQVAVCLAMGRVRYGKDVGADLFAVIDNDSKDIWKHFRMSRPNTCPVESVANLLTAATQANIALETLSGLLNDEDNAGWAIHNCIKYSRVDVVARLALAMAVQPFENDVFFDVLSKSKVFDKILDNHKDSKHYWGHSEELSVMLLALAHGNQLKVNATNVDFLWSLVCDRGKKRPDSSQNSAHYLRCLGEFHFLSVASSVDLNRPCSLQVAMHAAFQREWHQDPSSFRLAWNYTTRRRVIDDRLGDALFEQGFACHQPSGAHEYLGVAFADYERRVGIVYHDEKQYFERPNELASEGEEKFLGGLARNKERLLQGPGWNDIKYVSCFDWDRVKDDEEMRTQFVRDLISK